MWNVTSTNASLTMGSTSLGAYPLVSTPDLQVNLSFRWDPLARQRFEAASLNPNDVIANVSDLDPNISMMSFSMRTATKVAHVLEFNVTPVICVLGIALNIVNLLVLTERSLKESPYIYLRALAFTDLSALLMTSFFLALTSPPAASGFITSDGTPKGDFGVFYGAYFFLPLNSICNNSSTWIVVTLTVERFLFVKRPLWARDACTPSGAKLKTAGVMVGVGLVNIPRFLYYRVVPDPLGAEGLLQLRATEFRYSKANEKVLWFYSVMFGVVPLLILCVSNSYLIYAVKRARRQRQLLSIRNNMEAHWNREQTRLTLTLISIVCLAVVCILPAAFGDVVVMSYVFSGSDTLRQFLHSPFYKVFRSVSNMLLVCNMSLNFFLYSAFNDKFLRVLKKMVRRWLQRVTGHKQSRGPMYIGAGTHRPGVKLPSNASKEGSSLTKTSNTDHLKWR